MERPTADEQLVRQSVDERLVRQYLLGELTDEEREELEKRLLTDDSFYETFTAVEGEVEDELIDEFADGELAGPGREHFARSLSSVPERAAKLTLVRDLKEHAARALAAGRISADHVGRPPGQARARAWQQSAPFRIFRNPLVGLSCAAALLLAALLCVWLALKSNRLEAELNRLAGRAQPTPTRDAGLREQLDQLRSRNEELAENLRRSEEQRNALEEKVASSKSGEEGGGDAVSRGARPRQSRPAVFSLFLPPPRRGVSAAETEHVLKLPSGAARSAAQARLTLGVEGISLQDFKGFRARVVTSGGTEVWPPTAVRVTVGGGRGRAVLAVPAGRLPDGAYVAELTGLTVDGQSEPISSVPFRVVTE